MIKIFAQLKLSKLKTILVSLVLLFFVGCKQGSGAKDLAPGVPVSSYAVKRLDGSSVELKELFGKVTVVSLMASWCESCKSEFAELNSLHAKLAKRGGLVLGVALDDTIEALRAVNEEYKINFPVVLDTESRARSIFKLRGFPETLILDQNAAPKLFQDIDGNMTIKFVGPRPWAQPVLEQQILGMLIP